MLQLMKRVPFTDMKIRQVWKMDGDGLSVHVDKGQQGAADGSAFYLTVY